MKRLLASLSFLCLLAVELPLRASAGPGSAIFRSNCAFCHGLNGRGGRGPNLISSHVVQSGSPDELKSIVRNGIPGTGMPSFEIEADELDALIAYVRQLGSSGESAGVIRGDAARGAKIYAAKGCAGCHRIEGKGSVFGPDLSRAGSARSADYLRESVINPSADIASGYEGVAVVTKGGQKLAGVRINEDTFSVQVRLQDERFAMFSKSELKSCDDLGVSLMPAYGGLAPADLDDLLAYLSTLRGARADGSVNHVEGVH